MKRWKFIIVGSGIAGLTAYRTIRSQEPESSVLLVSGEDRLPYKRTKLSKFIVESFEREQFALVAPDDFPPPAQLELNCWIKKIDSERKVLTTKDDRQFQYEKLLLCLGAKPKTLPTLLNKPGVHFIREIAEMENLKEKLKEAKRVVILGNGILGVEAADQIRQLDKEVSILGLQESPMRKQLNPHLSGDLESRILEVGIQPFWGETIIEYCESANFNFQQYSEDYLVTEDLKKSRFLAITEQRILSCDLLVVCIGIQGRISVAKSAGIDCDGGIVVDEYLETSVSGIFAAGDGVIHPGNRVTQLWHEAEYQGLVASKNMMGDHQSWQDPIYRAKCEVFGQFYFSAGLSQHANEAIVWQEELKGDVYIAYWLQDGKIQALVMKGDKDRAKIYQQAVREQWTPTLLFEHLEV